MIQRISHYFATRLSKENGQENTDEIEILQYGIECIINTFIPVLIYIIVSCALGLVLPMTLWLLFFLILRNYIGGYHASSHGACIFCSIIYGICFLLIIKNISHVPLYLELLICSFFMIIHIIKGPIIHDEDLTCNFKKYKISGFLFLIFEIIVISILNYSNISYHMSIFISIISAELLYYFDMIHTFFFRR